MPLSKHYKGHGEEVMANMKKEYGSKKGERVFYATENKMKKQAGGKFRRSVMGRQVIHHSPDKHPEQTDPMAKQPSEYDLMLQRQDQGLGSGTYSGMRKDMKPMQQESPKPARTLDYLRKMIGGEK